MRTTPWMLGMVVALCAGPASAQVENPRETRLSTVPQWVGYKPSDQVEEIGRLWDHRGVRQAASEALGRAAAAEVFRVGGPEKVVARRGTLVTWAWCRRDGCPAGGYALVADPATGDLFVCRGGEAGGRGWAGTDPRMKIPLRGERCGDADVIEFARLNARR